MRYIWQHADWSNFTWQSDQLLDAVGKARFSQGKLLSKVNALGMKLSREAQAEILTEETVQTAAIEGETLDRDSVRSSVSKRLGLPIVGLPAAGRHVDGLVDVLMDATMYYKKPLTAKRLKSWQAALFPTGFSGLRRIRVGKWRGSEPMQVVSGPIGYERIHFEAPPSNMIDTEIRKFISWWEKGSVKMDGLLRAGIAHFRFITIHPFEDGNGRIARALTDMALAQDERLSTRFYSLSSRIMTERNDYYDILERCQKGNREITQWLKWFLGCFQQAVEDSQTLISKVLSKAEFWQQHGQTTLNDRQRKVINCVLDAGRDGFEGGLTTRKYVSMARVSRATAFREISDLVEKRILLQNEGRGRNANYGIRWRED